MASFLCLEEKRHSIKSQVVVDKRSKTVICTNFANGKKHDFKLFKDSRVRWTKGSRSVTDTGYQEIQKIHSNSIFPKKSSKKHPLTKEDKKTE